MYRTRIVRVPPERASNSGLNIAMQILRRKLILLAILYSGATILGGFLLSKAWDRVYGLQWTLLSSSVFLCQIFLLWQALPKNHRLDDSSIMPKFGVGNLLTITRGVLISWLAGFLFAPRPAGLLAWLPAAIYLAAAILDYFDGFAARIGGVSTELGIYWDQEMDSLGVVVAPLLGVVYGQLPVWALLVGASRYLFVLGIWWRKFNHRPVYDLPSSTYRRVFAGFQMGFFGFALFPIFSSASIWISLTVFMIPFMVGFLRDWLVVSGVVNAASEKYLKIVKIGTSLGIKIFPVVLRITAVYIGIRYGLLHIMGMPLALPADHTLPMQILGSLEIVLSVLLGSGIGGRITSLAFLLLAGFSLNGQEPGVMALVASTSYMTILGTGVLSIWQPEEDFVRRRYGGAEAC